jgi:hypothetical protein
MGVRLVGAVSAVIVLLGVIAYVVFDGGEGPTTLTASGPPTDAFDRRPPADGLGRSPGGQQWQSVRGSWGISQGRARTHAATPQLAPALATVDRPDPDGVVAVSVAQVAPGAGLLFRYEDPSNFWAVVVRPDSDEWLVVAVVDGMIVRQQVVGGGFLSPAAVAPDAQLELHLDGPWIDLFINDVKAEALYDERLQAATGAGLVAGGRAAPNARFDDFYSLPRD